MRSVVKKLVMGMGVENSCLTAYLSRYSSYTVFRIKFKQVYLMKCSKCKFQNPEEMKFCGKCGSKLAVVCDICGFKNPDGFGFCGKCGKALTSHSTSQSSAQAFGEKFEKTQHRFSRDIKEKIESQNKKIEGEYKQVTILFCDLKNFTPLTEELGSEEAYHVMDQVYEILIGKVHYYDGMVNEMTGDGILALFGAPRALEDAPQRAVRSSIEIHREIARLNNKFKKGKKQIPELKMRIGIHSGPVVVGSLGNDLKAGFKVVGDTVNLASRLEGLAEPGTTYVSEKIFKYTKGMFRFESLGEMKIKGKKKLEKVYRLISSSNKQTRFDVSAEQGLTPLVGRQRELDILLDGFDRIKLKNGQVFTVVSEAGIGKSRLLYEFRKAISNEDAFFLEGRCLSYSQGISYYLIIDILKSNFNIQDDDEINIRKKVTTGLNTLGLDDKPIAPYFLELLSVKNSGINPLLMSPEAMKDKIAESLKQILQKLSEIRPLVLTIEDLHWADQSSIEIINLLFEIIPGARVLVVFTYRPEFSPNWGSRSYQSQLTLYKLTTKQIAAMVNNILGPSHSNDGFIDFITAKTEGTPFFIEEFIKYLKEHNLIEKKGVSYVLNENFHDIKVPETIQEVIMARTDRVSEKAKDILKIGSAIEREFSFELIRNLVDYPESELLSILSLLKDSELIFERGIFPKSVYVFKHALIREIIYESILSDQKRKYHEKIGIALEKSVKDTLAEHYEILARHFILGESYAKGAEYSRFSCKKMLKTASPHNAITHAIKRIECLEKLKRNDDIETQIIGARILLGLLYTQKNYHVLAMETLHPILELAEKKGEKRKLSQIYTISGAYQYMVEDDFSGAFGPLKKALKLSEDSNDAISNMQASYWLGLGQALHCEFKEAECNLNKVLEANQAFNILWGISSLKSVISYFVYYYKGEIEKGFHTSREAVEFAEENQDIYSKAMAYVVHGVMCYCKGLFDTAEEHLTKGVKLCERSHFFTWNGMAQVCLGEMNYDTKKFDLSINDFNKLADLAKAGEVGPSWRNFGFLGAARAKTAMGDHDINLEMLTRQVNGIKVTSFEGSKLRLLSEIFVNTGQDYQSEAFRLIQNAIKADTINGMDFSLGKDYQEYARQLLRSGDLFQAKINYKKGIEIFKKCGADGWVKNTEKELALINQKKVIKN